MSDNGLLAPVWAATATATGDDAYLAAMLDVEAALARAGARIGLIPAEAAEAIAAACAAGFDAGGIAARAVVDGNPVIPLVADLRNAVGPGVADWVHHGATSQDILDTACILVAARVLARIDADLATAQAHAARLADAHRETVMAGRTLTQHAVPITFGLKAAGWLLRLIGGAAAHTAAMLSGLHVDTAAMRANMLESRGLLVAERVAAALTPHLGRLEAARLIGDLAGNTGPATTLRQLLGRDPRVAAALDTEALDRLCDPLGYLGASATFIERVLRRYRSTG